MAWLLHYSVSIHAIGRVHWDASNVDKFVLSALLAFFDNLGKKKGKKKRKVNEIRDGIDADVCLFVCLFSMLCSLYYRKFLPLMLMFGRSLSFYLSRILNIKFSFSNVWFCKDRFSSFWSWSISKTFLYSVFDWSLFRNLLKLGSILPSSLSFACICCRVYEIETSTFTLIVKVVFVLKGKCNFCSLCCTKLDCMERKDGRASWNYLSSACEW